MTRGRAGHEETLATAAAGLATAIERVVAAAVAEALAGHRCGPAGAADEAVLLTYEQAARRLGISLSKLYLLMRAGEIRSVALGPQTRRIPAAEIGRYVAACLARP